MYMKKSTVRSIIMLGLVAVLVVMVGGGILEKLSIDNLQKDKTTQTAKEEGLTGSDLEPVTEASTFEKTKSADQPTASKTAEKTEVILYFASAEGDKLVAEKRKIPTVKGIAKETVQELIKGPSDKKLKETLPKGTKLVDIDVKDGLATVSFSKEMHEKHLGSSNGEQITVYSIVNTLTQFPTIKRVQILIDGKAVETLAGHFGIADPIEKNTKIVKGE